VVKLRSGEPIRIERIELAHVRVPMREPFRISSGSVKEKDAIVVKLYQSGIAGYGEASPMAGSFYSEDTPESCLRELMEVISPQVIEVDFRSVEHLNRLLEILPVGNFSRAGVETAFWDLMGKIDDVPLYAMVGGMKERVESGLAVGLYRTIPELLGAIESELQHGYRRVKIKIAPGWDIEPVKAVRETFGDIDLFVDANASYTIKDINIFKRLDYYGLMMYEQPLPKDDLEGHAKLQSEVETPVCLDESATDLETVRRAVDMGACKIINIKIQRVGGILNAVRIHDFCRSRNIPVWCGTMPELGIGQAQGLALASMDNFIYPTDIEPSLRFYTDDIISPLIEMNPDGTIDVPGGPGIGHQVSEPKLREYEVGRWLIRT